MTRSRVVLLAATALAAVYGAALYAEQHLAGPGCCGATFPTPDPDQALRLAAQLDPEASDRARQSHAAVTSLAARPMDGEAWLRLAMQDRTAHGGRLTQEGRQALENSYLVMPYARTQAAWRVAFTLDAWNQVSAQTREDAVREAKIGDTAKSLAPLLADVSDPDGQDQGLDLIGS